MLESFRCFLAMHFLWRETPVQETTIPWAVQQYVSKARDSPSNLRKIMKKKWWRSPRKQNPANFKTTFCWFGCEFLFYLHFFERLGDGYKKMIDKYLEISSYSLSTSQRSPYQSGNHRRSFAFTSPGKLLAIRTHEQLITGKWRENPAHGSPITTV